MGNENNKSTNSPSKSKKHALTSSEVTEFKNISSFSEQIVLKLYTHYSLFCAVHSDDGVIEYSEFCYIIGKQDNELTRRIFMAIDTNNDTVINFREFIKFFGTFHFGTLDEKEKILYKIFSDSETKTINSNTMYKIILDIVKSERRIKDYFDKDTVERIVMNTFEQVKGLKIPDEGDKLDRTRSKVSVKDSGNNITLKDLKDSKDTSSGPDPKVSTVSATSNNSAIPLEKHKTLDSSKSVTSNSNNLISKSVTTNTGVQITYQQFKALIDKFPCVLNWMKLDLEHIKNSRIIQEGVKKCKSHC